MNIGGSVSLTDCTISGDPLPQQFAKYGILNQANGDITFLDSTIQWLHVRRRREFSMARRR